MGERMVCECCGEDAWRDSVNVGVGIIYGPWGCSCGWSEVDEYDGSKGGGVQPDGSYVSPQGLVYPPGNLVAKALARDAAKQAK